MSESSVIELTSGSFDDAIEKNSEGILVDFFATWCAPCRSMSPIVEEIAAEGKEGRKIKVGKLNVDECSDIAGRYNVMSIPAFIYFEGGKEKKRAIGAMPKEELLKRLL